MASILLQSFKSGPLKDSGIIQHLCNLIRAELDSKNALKDLNQIQILSYFLRTHSFKFKQLLEDKWLLQKIHANKQYSEYIQKVKALNQQLAKNENSKNYVRPDLNTEFRALKSAGICLGETNYYYLDKVIKNLAAKNNVKEIRFWGKILGRKDYYVIQGISLNSYLNELPKDSQGYGVGINSYSYWVSTDILGNWIELPLVTPQQLKSSKQFKYIFSGDLQQPINSFVPFPGKQKHLLKCQIARITHSCYLSPKGLYRPTEADPTAIQFEQIEQGYKLPQVQELANIESWVHLPPNILNSGRVTHYIDPSLNEEQRQTVKAQLQQKDPLSERLKGIGEDRQFQYGGVPATNNWTSKLYGETVPVNQINKLQGQSLVYGVALLRNLTWPGSATVGYQGGWTNIYVGYGHKATQELKVIKQLADLQTQGQDNEQKPEPNPSKPPAEKPVEVAEPGEPVQAPEE